MSVRSLQQESSFTAESAEHAETDQRTEVAKHALAEQITGDDNGREIVEYGG